MIEQVKQQIRSAFSRIEKPSRLRLLGPTTGDKKGERRIQRELAGKDWQSLTAPFLEQRWASFCYLSAEGFRYYLPALLINCLENFSEANDLIHSTVFELQPDYCSLYHSGEDQGFQYQTSLFTDEQYTAVCSFLGLVFDLLPRYKFQSALALKWGWNKQEHPASLKCRQYYEELHNYAYPTSEDDEPEVVDLCQQIETAFHNTPYPGDRNICDSVRDHEPAEIALEFRGLKWQTIHPDLLAYQYSSLSFFSPEGFRYFLPAYLIADLGMSSSSNADPVFHLTHGLYQEKPFRKSDWSGMGVSDEGLDILEDYDRRQDKTDWYQYAIKKFSLFDKEERKAIIAYLEYSGGEEADQALETYWRKS